MNPIEFRRFMIGYWLGCSSGVFGTSFISENPLTHTFVLMFILFGFLLYEKYLNKPYIDVVEDRNYDNK